jgi:DNA-binding SARP family transcriptional activator
LLRVYLTGRLAVEGPDGMFEEADLPGNQARVALAALAVERIPLGRERLAQIVWGDQLPDGWSGSLNSMISKTRALFDRIGADGKAVITSSGGAYQVVLPPGAWVDVEVAQRGLDRAEGFHRRGDVDQALPEATSASAVFRRPFLSGVYRDWVADVRTRHELGLYRCYEVLSDGWRIQGDPQLAASIAEQAITLDPFRETGYRLLMEAELARGDTVAALRVFDRCERMMQDEFGATPSSATLAILERARTA